MHAGTCKKIIGHAHLIKTAPTPNWSPVHVSRLISSVMAFQEHNLKPYHSWLVSGVSNMEFQSWQNYQTQIHCQFHCKCMGKFKYIVNFVANAWATSEAWSKHGLNAWSNSNANALSNANASSALSNGNAISNANVWSINCEWNSSGHCSRHYSRQSSLL